MSDPFENYTQDITKVPEANAQPADFTRRKIPCVSMGRVVNSNLNPNADAKPLSER